MPIHRTLPSAGVPIQVWTDEVDEASLRQLANTASLPFVFHHVAAMPDVHLGHRRDRRLGDRDPRRDRARPRSASTSAAG